MFKEQVAEELFYEDWDAESGYAYANAPNGYWGEQDELLKDHYRKRAGIVTNLFRAEVEKLVVIGDDEIMKAHEGEKCRDCGKSIAQAELQDCQRKLLERLE